jgi:hypothetical protein
MPVNFDAAIPFFGEWVAAIGPEHPKEKIKEICVWVYQPAPDGSGDVAATEMTTHEPGPGQHPHFLRVDGATPKDPGRWLLPVKRSASPNPNSRTEGRPQSPLRWSSRRSEGSRSSGWRGGTSRSSSNRTRSW